MRSAQVLIGLAFWVGSTRRGAVPPAPMLTLLNAIQLILYIALLTMVGQGVLYLLAGARREGNAFYLLLRAVGRPFTWLVERLTPVRVSRRHVPWITFGLLLLAYLVVTKEKIDVCIDLDMVGCR